jgi:hypothetical protein
MDPAVSWQSLPAPITPRSMAAVTLGLSRMRASACTSPGYTLSTTASTGRQGPPLKHGVAIGQVFESLARAGTVEARMPSVRASCCWPPTAVRTGPSARWSTSTTTRSGWWLRKDPRYLSVGASFLNGGPNPVNCPHRVLLASETTPVVPGERLGRGRRGCRGGRVRRPSRKPCPLAGAPPLAVVVAGARRWSARQGPLRVLALASGWVAGRRFPP